MEDLDSNNKKVFWKIVKYFVKGQKYSTIPPLVSNYNGKNTFYVTNQEKADHLNDYFVSISSVNDTGATLPTMPLKTDRLLNNLNVTEQEIQDVISTLNINKACGHDLISHKMLKNTVQSVAKPLCLLFNRSLNEGLYPDNWKIANVTPLFKKGDKSEVSNYRPVSLLSCCGKLFERLVFKHL